MNENNNTNETTNNSLNPFQLISILYLLVIIVSTFFIASSNDFESIVWISVLMGGLISFFLFYMIATVIEKLDILISLQKIDTDNN